MVAEAAVVALEAALRPAHVVAAAVAVVEVPVVVLVQEVMAAQPVEHPLESPC